MRQIPQFPAPPDLAEIRKQLSPGAGAVERYPDCLWDTMTYPAAGLAKGATLDYFSDPAHVNDLTKSNMRGFINQMQPGHTFVVQAITLDFMRGASYNPAASKVGIADDIQTVRLDSLSVLRYSNERDNKQRNAYGLHMVGGSARIAAAVAGHDSAAAGFVQIADNDGGPLPFYALLAEQQGFGWSLISGALKAISADLDIRLGLWGWHYQER